MTIAEHLELIRASLDLWAADHRSSCHIAPDPAHLYAMVFEATPGGVGAYISFVSEEVFGDFSEESGMISRTFQVVISQGKGFQAEPADSFTKADSAGEAMYDLVESCRQAVRAMTITPYDDENRDAMDLERALAYRGARPWKAAQGLPVDAMELEFKLAVQLPEAEATE
jgi:hypothetical protein